MKKGRHMNTSFKTYKSNHHNKVVPETEAYMNFTAVH